MSAIDHQSSKFEERDLFLQVLVGLVAATRRVDRLLSHVERHQHEVQSRPEPHGKDEILFALLGIVSFRRKLGAALDAARREGESAREIAGAEARAAAPRWPDEILR